MSPAFQVAFGSEQVYDVFVGRPSWAGSAGGQRVARRLLIPGTGGCFYATKSGKRVGSILDLARGQQKAFTCAHAADTEGLEPLRTTGQIDGLGSPVEIVPAGPIRAVYKPFFEAVRPGTTKRLYTFFDYDWRLDIRLSGQRLVGFFDSAGASRWDIVCHSQGGLVLAWASILAGPARFRRWVRRIVFMGVPLQGTVSAAAGLLDGVELLGNAVKADAPTVRTWPSVYQMLPRWRVHAPNSAGVELFKNRTWSAAGKLGSSTDTSKGVDPDLLARARAYKLVMDKTDFAALQSVDKLVLLFGHNHNTRARIPKFPRLPSEARRDGQVIARGDGLVPIDTTFTLLPSAVKDRVDSILTPVRSHMLMASSLAKFSQCEGIFQA